MWLTLSLNEIVLNQSTQNCVLFEIRRLTKHVLQFHRFGNRLQHNLNCSYQCQAYEVARPVPKLFEQETPEFVKSVPIGNDRQDKEAM